MANYHDRLTYLPAHSIKRQTTPFAVGVHTVYEVTYYLFTDMRWAEEFAATTKVDQTDAVVTRWVALEGMDSNRHDHPWVGWREVTYFNLDKDDE